MADVKHLVIIREQWLRGGDQNGERGFSWLLSKASGKRCCLGFYAQSLGASDDLIRNRTSPGGTSELGIWPSWLLGPFNGDSRESNSLMLINDSSTLPDERRELLIKQIFAAHGVEVNFVDGEVQDG